MMLGRWGQPLGRGEFPGCPGGLEFNTETALKTKSSGNPFVRFLCEKKDFYKTPRESS